jgi:hypothetical protein
MIAFFFTIPIRRMMPMMRHHAELAAGEDQRQRARRRSRSAAVERIVTG